jgi:hypothetical protein
VDSQTLNKIRIDPALRLPISKAIGNKIDLGSEALYNVELHIKNQDQN